MKRTIIVLLTALMCFGICIPGASASQVTVQASLDENSGKVTISGSLGTAAGSIVTVQVRNPLNQLDYLDQGTTAANGQFQFSYTLRQKINGTYTVKAGGQDADAVESAAFKVATATDSGSGSSSSPSPPSAASPPSAQGEVNGSGIILEAQLDSATGMASARLTADILNKAREAGGNDVTVEIARSAGADRYELIVDAGLFSPASKGLTLSLITDIAAATIRTDMLSGVDLSSAKEVGLRIGRADTSRLPGELRSKIGGRPVIELHAAVDGSVITFSNPDTAVTVAIPYQPAEGELKNPEHIVIWYLDAQNRAQAIPSGKYDPAGGKVSFTTTHFSAFAIAYTVKTFGDLGSFGWARQAIEVMASKGVISGTSETAYNPGAAITRADFMILITKALGLSARVSSNFSDVASADYYFEAVGVAKQLGLAEGEGNNRFNPQSPISRQDMMVLMSRAMKLAGKSSPGGAEADLARFADRAEVASYAVNDVAAMVRAGIVEGDGSALHPLGSATRAEAAVLLYRIYNK